MADFIQSQLKELAEPDPQRRYLPTAIYPAALRDDLDKVYGWEQLYFNFDMHWTPAGHRLVARELERLIANRL